MYTHIYAYTRIQLPPASRGCAYLDGHILLLEAGAPCYKSSIYMHIYTHIYVYTTDRTITLSVLYLLPLAVVAHIWMAIFFYSKQARLYITLSIYRSIYIYICTSVYIYIYTHIYMHIHIYNLLPLAVVAHIWMAIFFYSKQTRLAITKSSIYMFIYTHIYVYITAGRSPSRFTYLLTLSRGSSYLDGHLLLLEAGAPYIRIYICLHIYICVCLSIYSHLYMHMYIYTTSSR